MAQDGWWRGGARRRVARWEVVIAQSGCVLWLVVAQGSGSQPSASRLVKWGASGAPPASSWLTAQFVEGNFGSPQAGGGEVGDSVQPLLASRAGFSRAKRLFQLNQEKTPSGGVCRLPGGA